MMTDRTGSHGSLPPARHPCGPYAPENPLAPRGQCWVDTVDRLTRVDNPKEKLADCASRIVFKLANHAIGRWVILASPWSGLNREECP